MLWKRKQEWRGMTWENTHTIVWMQGQQRPCMCGANMGHVFEEWLPRWSRNAMQRTTVCCTQCRPNEHRLLMRTYVTLRKRIRRALEQCNAATETGRTFGEEEISGVLHELINSMGYVGQQAIEQRD